MASLHDLRFSLPPNSKSRLCYALNHAQYAYQIPVAASKCCWRTFTSGCLRHCKGAKQKNIRCIASSLKFLWYGSMEWNMKENFSMEWNIEENFRMEYGMEDFWYGMEMEWKKIASMEYGKIVFHSIPYHALVKKERVNANLKLILLPLAYISPLILLLVSFKRKNFNKFGTELANHAYTVSKYCYQVIIAFGISTILV